MAEFHGVRLLGEIEESSLEDILADLRNSSTSTTAPPTRTGIPAIDALWSTAPSHPLTVHGTNHGLPLLYHIIDTAVSAPHNKCIIVIDTTASFQVTHLSLPYSLLQHVHIYHHSSSPSSATPPTSTTAATPAMPTDSTSKEATTTTQNQAKPPNELETLIRSLRHWSLYAAHKSLNRELLGIAVVGATTAEADMTFSWRGRVRVVDEREEVLGFGLGSSAEEAFGERELRGLEVERRGWKGMWDGGAGGGLRWKG